MEFTVGPEFENSKNQLTIMVMDLPKIVKARSLAGDSIQCLSEARKHLLKLMEA